MRRLGAVLCVLSLGGLLSSALAATITWTGAANSNWGNANNWDLLRPPTAGDDVFITTAGAVSNDNIADPAINWLNISSSSAVVTINSGRTLTVGTVLTLANGSTLNAAGRLIVQGGGGIDGTLSTTGTNGVITLSGTFGSAATPQSGVINNAGGGSTLSLSGATLYGGTLSGAGAINASGPNDSNLNNVTNDTTLTVTGGNRTTFAGGTNNGVLEAITGPGRKLVVDGTAAAVTNSGVIQSNGGAVTILGTIDNSGSIDNIGGTLTLDGATINGGTVGGSGTIRTTGNNALNGVLNNTTVTVDGTAGTTTFAAGTNSASGILEAVTNNNHILSVDGSVDPVFNQGLIRSNGGAVVLTGTIDNTGGTIANIGTGALRLEGATVSNGSIAIDAGSTLQARYGDSQLNGVTLAQNGSFTINGGTALQFLNGSFSQSAGATTTINGTLTSPSTDLTITGGAIAVNGNLRVNNATFTSDSAVTVGSGGRIAAGAYDQTGGSLSVDGIVTANGSGFTQNGDVGIHAGGSLTALTYTHNSGNLTVAGELDTTAGSGTRSFLQYGGNLTVEAGGVLNSSRNYYQTGGAATINGTLTAGPEGDRRIAIAGGVLNGTGTLEGAVVIRAGGRLEGGLTINGSLINNGTLAIGDPAVMDVFGDYTQSGLWDVEIDGPLPGSGYDQLNVNGNATLGGTLVFDMGYVPRSPATFPFLTCTPTSGPCINGTWGNVQYNGAGTWRLIYDVDSVSLEVDGVPEPATVLLIGLALPALYFVRRRRA